MKNIVLAQYLCTENPCPAPDLFLALKYASEEAYFTKACLAPINLANLLGLEELAAAFVVTQQSPAANTTSRFFTPAAALSTTEFKDCDNLCFR